jgi:hypothetical protein
VSSIIGSARRISFIFIDHGGATSNKRQTGPDKKHRGKYFRQKFRPEEGGRNQRESTANKRFIASRRLNELFRCGWPLRGGPSKVVLEMNRTHFAETFIQSASTEENA